MNETEAKELIQREVDGLRPRPYSTLREMIGAEPITGERIGSCGESSRDEGHVSTFAICPTTNEYGVI